MYRVGTPVIFRKSKCSTHPGPRARDVRPARRGDTYSYCVDKLWVVVDRPDSERVVVQTRRAKTYVLNVNDGNLRPARWWERLRYRHRFPQFSPHSF